MRKTAFLLSFVLAFSLFTGFLPTSASAASEPEIVWLPTGWEIETFRDYDDLFHDGYLNIRKARDANGDYLFYDSPDSCYGFMDTAGNVVALPHKFTLSGSFHSGRLVACDEETGLSGCFDTKGNVAIPFEYPVLYDFHDDGYAYARDDYWKNERYIDVNGNDAFLVDDYYILTEGSYSVVYYYGVNDYRATVYGSDGHVIASEIPADESSRVCYLGEDRIAITRYSDLYIVDPSGKTVAYFPDGLPHVSAGFFDFDYFEEHLGDGFVLVGRDEDGDGQATEGGNDTFSISDRNGNLLCDFGTYSLIGSMGDAHFDSNGLIGVKDRKTGKYGCIDSSGKLVIPCQYDEFPEQVFEDGKYYFVYSGDESYMVDQNNKIVTKFPNQYRGDDIDIRNPLLPVDGNGGLLSYGQRVSTNPVHFETVLLDVYGNKIMTLRDKEVCGGQDGYLFIAEPVEIGNFAFFRYGLMKDPLSQATGATYQFRDVPITHWAYSAVSRMADMGVINGIGNYKFAPNDTVNYAQFTTMIVRSFYNSSVGNTGATWYSAYVDAAAKAGILQGTGIGNDTSAITTGISRYDMAQMMYNVLVQKRVKLPSNFDKAVIGDWASVPSNYQDAVSACYGLGILKGTDNQGTFHGESTMTRAQAAVAMDRIIKICEGSAA